MSYEFNSLYPSAQIDTNSTRSNIETAYPIANQMNGSMCSLFNSGRWKELNRCAFLTVKYHNPEKLVFQHLPLTDKIKNPYKHNRLGENNRIRNGITMTGQFDES